MESLGDSLKYTDDRIKIVEKHGLMLPKDIAGVAGVSGPAISQWIKPLVEKGILTWCEESGDEFTDVKSLEKAKRSGKAFIRIAGFIRLPTPFELTGDKSWDVDGVLFKMYDLELGDDPIESEVLSTAVEEPNASIDFSENIFDGVKIINPDDNGGGVKALSENTVFKNKIEKSESEISTTDENVIGDELFGEFETILSSEKSNFLNPLPNKDTDKLTDLVEPKNNSNIDGILTI